MQGEKLVGAQQAGFSEVLRLVAEDGDDLRGFFAKQPAVGSVIFHRINVVARADDLRRRAEALAREGAGPVILRAVAVIDVHLAIAQEGAQRAHVLVKSNGVKTLAEAAAGEGFQPRVSG